MVAATDEHKTLKTGKYICSQDDAIYLFLSNMTRQFLIY